MNISENARVLFIEESREHLQNIETVLLAMEEAGPEARSRFVDQAFRAAHSIKGGAGFLGYGLIRDLAHGVEDTLDSIREGVFFPGRSAVTVLLRAFDLLGRLLDRPDDSDVDIKEMLAELTSLPEREDAAESSRPEDTACLQSPPPRESVEEIELFSSCPVFEESVRVPAAVLDRLMNLAGQMVMGRNRLLQMVAQSGDRELLALAQQISQATADLQDQVMTARTQPLSRIADRLPRLVRDLADQLGKDIGLTMSGLDVGLDKGLLDKLVNPLNHLVRNSADHGIEPPEERLQCRKPARGTMELRAWHGQGMVHVELRDDGRGMNRSRILEQAVGKGIVDAERASELSLSEQLQLALLPGVSSARQVTDLSGRGVGMDVVRTLMEEVGGRVDLASEPGKGTRVRLSFPPSLIIMPCVQVRVGNSRYALPQSAVVELLRIPSESFSEEVSSAAALPMLHIRGNPVPVSMLAGLLDPQRPDMDPARYASERTHVHVVVVKVGGGRHALVVEDTEEVFEAVTRPAGRWLSACPAYSGVTLLTDGTPVVILDAFGLLTMAGIDMRLEQADEVQGKGSEPAVPVSAGGGLLFHNAPGERFLIPLDRVERVEKVAVRDIELVGGRKMARFQGEGVPLYALEEVMQTGVLEDGPGLVCLILRAKERRFGLLASRPLESLDELPVTDSGHEDRPGVAGICPVGGRTATLLDPDALERLFVESGQPLHVSPSPVVPVEKTILVAEDSQFFRERIAEVLRELGLHVLTAPDGLQAWDMLKQGGDDVDLMVTDLEMPNMDGFELVRKVRADARFKTLPVLALSSLAGSEDMEAARKAGVDEYLVKLDEEQLLQRVQAGLGI